jgi:hypothetical protein
MSTLDRFGVPLDQTGGIGMLHPKQQYRFRVIFKGFGDGTRARELTQNVVTVQRPSYTFDEAEIHSYNSIAWIAGKQRFNEIEVVLRDDITNAVVSAVGAQAQKQKNYYEQTSAVAAINYTFTMEIHSLDGTANGELERWELEGCWLKSVTHAEGDYSSSEPNLVTIQIRYSNATHIQGPNTNNGTVVGGNPFPNIPSPTGGAIIG